MQDAIILYENGKAIGGEGHPTNASDITFDNTGTDLVSENVEDAVKEVNAKFDKGSVSVTADGSKTYGSLFNELYALVDHSKVTHNVKLTLDSITNVVCYHLEQYSPAAITFSFTTLQTNSPLISLIRISNSSILREWNGTTINDISINVPSAGSVFTIYY